LSCVFSVLISEKSERECLKMSSAIIAILGEQPPAAACSSVSDTAASLGSEKIDGLEGQLLVKSSGTSICM
jgi:hypothetical protein